MITGSALLNPTGDDLTGLRVRPIMVVGRFAGLLGPSATPAQVRAWLAEAGFTDVTLEMSGAIGYFRGVKG